MVSAWLKGACWRVLAEMHEKKQEAAPSWELTWRSITEMVTGPRPVLLAPVALALVHKTWGITEQELIIFG